jgi:molybdopterin-containing oxidoreductase family membrane subunit
MQNPSDSRAYWKLVATGGLFAAIGLLSAWYMESHGHIVTGMNNQIVWGIPHVFAIFLIVAASGVLNVASIGSVFGKPEYKVRAPLSGLLSIAMLAGGLTVLMLDLGRPDRVIVAATNYNLTSVFAWNVLLYSGLFTLVGLYLWTMMDKRLYAYSRPAGFAVFAWRFILTTGTGLIFAFLVARQAYASALLPPMFIVLSFAWGLAVFLIVQTVMYRWNGVSADPAVTQRIKRLLGLFLLGSLYMVAAYHLTNMYFAKNSPYEQFILFNEMPYAWLFWIGYVLIGNVLPLFLVFYPDIESDVKCAVPIAAFMAVIGAVAFLYVLIVGGQAYPLDIFPGYEASSSFGDGQVGHYAPSLPEFLLGIGGVAIAFLITVVGVRVFNFMPRDGQH